MARLRTAVSAIVAFTLLVVAWELAKAVLPEDGVRIGDTRVLPRTDDAAMPHVWTVLARLGEPEVAGAAAQRTVGEAVASGALWALGGYDHRSSPTSTVFRFEQTGHRMPNSQTWSTPVVEILQKNIFFRSNALQRTATARILILAS